MKICRPRTREELLQEDFQEFEPNSGVWIKRPLNNPNTIADEYWDINTRIEKAIESLKHECPAPKAQGAIQGYWNLYKVLINEEELEIIAAGTAVFGGTKHKGVLRVFGEYTPQWFVWGNCPKILEWDNKTEKWVISNSTCSTHYYSIELIAEGIEYKGQPIRMNRHTAGFFTVAHILYEGDADAVGVAFDLVTSAGFTGFGRQRRWEALQKVAPKLAQALKWACVDIIYIDTGAPERCYKAVVREINKAEQWIKEHGRPIAMICTAFDLSMDSFNWPKTIWKRAVWRLVNNSKLDEVDQRTGGLPLPRDVRENLVKDNIF